MRVRIPDGEGGAESAWLEVIRRGPDAAIIISVGDRSMPAEMDRWALRQLIDKLEAVEIELKGWKSSDAHNHGL